MELVLWPQGGSRFVVVKMPVIAVLYQSGFYEDSASRNDLLVLYCTCWQQNRHM